MILSRAFLASGIAKVFLSIYTILYRAFYVRCMDNGHFGMTTISPVGFGSHDRMPGKRAYDFDLARCLA